jgi:hypothetical protein
MDRLLDDTIALALGWKRQPSGWWLNHNHTMSPAVPFWSLEPGEAWGLVEWARQHDMCVKLEIDALHVTCVFSVEGPTGWESVSCESAERMPEAVSRAFLAALKQRPRPRRTPSAWSQ